MNVHSLLNMVEDRYLEATMTHCTHCGGEIDRAKVEHIVKGKDVYHTECYRVKRYWQDQEKEQSEMVRRLRESGH